MVEDLVEVVLGVNVVDWSLQLHEANNFLFEFVEFVLVFYLINGPL